MHLDILKKGLKIARLQPITKALLPPSRFSKLFARHQFSGPFRVALIVACCRGGV